jgi:RNase adapter protein RapZ
MRVVLITGISGSGKSIALNTLEDDGYYCIDNLPSRFLHEIITSLQDAGHDRIAVAIDARSGESIHDLRQLANGLGRYGQDIKIIFLNARTDVLIQRYSESRRRHPMSILPDAEASMSLAESIEKERELMGDMQDAGVVLDTSDLNPNVLRTWVRELVGSERSPLTLMFQSFAFKHGVPLDADLVFDVRCLPNPHYVQELSALTGKDAPVVEYLESIPSVQRMIDHISEFLQTWLPNYVMENRSYMTVAVGCTGGQHRSVYCVETLAKRFRRVEQVLVRHRGLAAKAAKVESA